MEVGLGVYPIQILAYQEFAHRGVVCVVHSDGIGLETVVVGQDNEFVGIVVGHEEVAGNCFTGFEEAFVFEFVMDIQALAGFLAGCGIGRVDKKGGGFL